MNIEKNWIFSYALLPFESLFGEEGDLKMGDLKEKETLYLNRSLFSNA